MTIEKKNSKLETVIKTGTFIISIVGAVTAYISFQQGCHKPDPFPERKDVYVKLSSIIGEIESVQDTNQLRVLSYRFDSLYNGSLKIYEDTVVSLAMRKFRLEVDDKLNGRKNLLEPFKLQQTGDALIITLKNQIHELQ